MEKPVYLDYNATTPIDPEVANEMIPYIQTFFGNPSSSYSVGKQNKDAIREFWKLMQGTAERKHFGTFSKSRLEYIFNEDISELFLAEYEGEVDAAAEVIFFGDTAVYLHACTSGKNEKLTASYLLIWEILKAAKDSGLKYFDLWGIDNNRWPGVTAFKESFGGDEHIYPEARIIIYKRFRYFVYRSLHFIRRFLAKLSL